MVARVKQSVNGHKYPFIIRKQVVLRMVWEPRRRGAINPRSKNVVARLRKGHGGT